MPLRPGSIIKVMVEGAAPLDTLVTSAWLFVTTLNVSLPLPRLFTWRAWWTPRRDGSRPWPGTLPIGLGLQNRIVVQIAQRQVQQPGLGHAPGLRAVGRS